MNGTILYGVIIILLIISAMKDKKKTKKAIMIGFKSFMKLLPSLIPMLIFIGLILAIFSPDTISSVLGEKSGTMGVVTGLVMGSIAFMPAFVAFPLGANLLTHGAGYAQIAAFVSSLMAVGIISIGIEMEYFGKKTTILRNSLGLVASIVFSIIIWRAM